MRLDEWRAPIGKKRGEPIRLSPQNGPRTTVGVLVFRKRLLRPVFGIARCPDRRGPRSGVHRQSAVLDFVDACSTRSA